MAYGTATQETNYWRIYQSKFELEVDSYREGAIQRPKGDKFIWAIHANYIEGTLTDVSFKEGPYGKEMNIRIEDVLSKQVNIISMKAENYLAINFLKMFPNIKLNFDLTISISKDKDSGFDSIYLRQYNTYVKYFYTNANPNGLPPTKKKNVVINNETKEVTDYSDQIAFFEKLVNSRFGKIETPAPQNPIAPSENQTSTVSTPQFTAEPAGEDDLPF